MDSYGADDLRSAAEIIPGRLYFHCLQQPMTLTTAPPNSICVHLDADLIYEPFCADFGPCNLAHSWRFCQRVNELLQRVSEAADVRRGARECGGQGGSGTAASPCTAPGPPHSPNSDLALPPLSSPPLPFPSAISLQSNGRQVYLLVGSHPHKRSNAAALVGIYSVLHLGMEPEAAYAPLRALEPFTGFRDASCGVPTYQLPVAQVIAGMYRAKQVGG